MVQLLRTRPVRHAQLLGPAPLISSPGASVIVKKSGNLLTRPMFSFDCSMSLRNLFSATAQVESSAVQVKFFERRKGRVFHHPASVNFDCGRFESGWLVYTDMVETSKVAVCHSQHDRCHVHCTSSHCGGSQ